MSQEAKKVVFVAGTALLAFAVVAAIQAHVMPIPFVGRYLPRAA